MERMARNKEETMFSGGWKFTESNPNITAHQLQSSIIATLQWKKVKASRSPPSMKKAKVQKVVAKGSGSILDVDNVGMISSMSKIRIVDPDILKTEATKGQEKDTGGMNKYIEYFPFQYREFDIPVQNCWLALDHYNARIMDKNMLSVCYLDFHGVRPSLHHVHILNIVQEFAK